jgi:hypothetical protein
MGYGNPLFDGDEPLPSPNAAQRIVSMRLLFRGLRPRTGNEVACVADRDEDGTGVQCQRSEDHGDRDPRG